MPSLAVNTGLFVAAGRPPSTRLDREGLTSRTGLLTTRRATWDAVVSVEPPGRFDLHSTATLHDGSRLDLPGLPLEVVELLRRTSGTGDHEAEVPVRSAPPTGGDEGWDGPFHRSGDDGGRRSR